MTRCQRDTIPGNKPHSANPKKNLAAAKPEKLCVNPIKTMIIDQTIMIELSQIRGVSFFNRRFEGTSNKTYPTKKSDRQILYWVPVI